jgi:protein-ribulosamine 3-kinase
MVPYLTPTPFGWGTYAADLDVHFFVCEFVDMTDTLPDMSVMKGLADLHKKAISPNGKCGFEVPTLQGTIPQYTEWTESWEDFFSKSIQQVFEAEESHKAQTPRCKNFVGKFFRKLCHDFYVG